MMTIKHVRDRGQTPKPTEGKVLGLVDTVNKFKSVIRALNKAGFTEIEEFHGEEGLHLFERVHGFAFGESEDKFFDKHRQALKEGQILLAIETTSKRATEVADVAATHGARFLVHFGFAAVTWLK